jgi:hypothetical protein
MPQTRSVIGHGIDNPGEVRKQGEVAMVPLVQGLEAKKAGGWFRCGGRTFALPIHGRGVVGTRVYGAFAEVECVDEHILVRHGGGQFEIGVGDRARGVIPRDKSGLDVGRERFPPHNGGVSGIVGHDGRR